MIKSILKYTLYFLLFAFVLLFVIGIFVGEPESKTVDGKPVSKDGSLKFADGTSFSFQAPNGWFVLENKYSIQVKEMFHIFPENCDAKCVKSELEGAQSTGDVASETNTLVVTTENNADKINGYFRNCPLGEAEKKDFNVSFPLAVCKMSYRDGKVSMYGVLPVVESNNKAVMVILNATSELSMYGSIKAFQQILNSVKYPANL